MIFIFEELIRFIPRTLYYKDDAQIFLAELLFARLLHDLFEQVDVTGEGFPACIRQRTGGQWFAVLEGFADRDVTSFLERPQVNG